MKSCTAEAVVELSPPNELFSSILKGVINRTMTAGMVAGRNPSEFDNNLTVAIDKATARYGEEWKANMIEGWSSLSKSELEQVCSAVSSGNKSSFMEFASKVGPKIQLRNEPLMKKAAVEILTELNR
jgi:hypothetical protein